MAEKLPFEETSKFDDDNFTSTEANTNRTNTLQILGLAAMVEIQLVFLLYLNYLLFLILCAFGQSWSRNSIYCSY